MWKIYKWYFKWHFKAFGQYFEGLILVFFIKMAQNLFLYLCKVVRSKNFKKYDDSIFQKADFQKCFKGILNFRDFKILQIYFWKEFWYHHFDFEKYFSILSEME